MWCACVFARETMIDFVCAFSAENTKANWNKLCLQEFLQFSHSFFCHRSPHRHQQTMILPWICKARKLYRSQIEIHFEWRGSTQNIYSEIDNVRCVCVSFINFIRTPHSCAYNALTTFISLITLIAIGYVHSLLLPAVHRSAVPSSSAHIAPSSPSALVH